MNSEMLLLVYAGTIGFVAAGITASFYRMVTCESPRFGPSGSGSLAWAAAIAFGALAGPVIIVQNVRNSIREGRVPHSMLAAGIVIAGIWSGCTGILVLELVSSVRDSLA
ncbi:MAG: hypothetical protein KDJ86_11095 [Bauldia sp.]|uniref:DUF6949 family protein n=1 Tax=Bauldia sp. TaxID=2575872 RepID=UPI001D87BC65|nr:hypothetical protein [Bauldia sp.]MCB1496325.1 hypothetical protein [Bauldia sp.]